MTVLFKPVSFESLISSGSAPVNVVNMFFGLSSGVVISKASSFTRGVFVVKDSLGKVVVAVLSWGVGVLSGICNLVCLCTKCNLQWNSYINNM